MMTGLLHYLTVNITPAKNNVIHFFFSDKGQTQSFEVRLCKVRSWRYFISGILLASSGPMLAKNLSKASAIILVIHHFISNNKSVKCSLNFIFINDSFHQIPRFSQIILYDLKFSS